MKLQLLSDTHGSPYFIDQNADLIVHLGDFGNGLKGALNFMKIVKNLVNLTFLYWETMISIMKI